MKIRENVLLAPYTTFRIGGAARYFVDAGSEEEIAEAIGYARRKGLSVFLLGGGSNILISDRGFDGLVIKVGIKGISIAEIGDESESESMHVTAKAGEDWDAFVEWCVANDLAGIECLSGIPGLVGGTPIQNVGAYGQEVSESVVSVRVLDREDFSFLELAGTECDFGYRSSLFNTSGRERFAVLSVKYLLRKGGKPKIEYPDLVRVFDNFEPSLAEMRSAVCSIRASKGMMTRQGGPDSQSAGSFFKNPVVSKEDRARIENAARDMGLMKDHQTVPGFAMPGDLVKIPAAWLIERAGFPKGYLKGNAGLSTRHTLALTNRGGATANDILALRSEISAKVRELFGVELVQEPELVGFEADA
ncbi:MAG: UDP-N-acetylmuramate dehydrogenase [Acidobacteria bacterium]|nr:MAG: UDP-N-acetylmuramate dehydrogenase [Acidobacteriota bacterium]REK03108.1 MAG: UDP-N-acetylmuramate dehydrogenase [Acidobacteriota bacterium]REK15456.1 MAG: UDP-N-acetylmuramate dehydrogenase [Acidobacteriota bacterium]REK45806.1 MAG: UDP-N-acetylmuramate dehydrogenase [Acidobacteriota bacterium]